MPRILKFKSEKKSLSIKKSSQEQYREELNPGFIGILKIMLKNGLAI